MDELRTKLRDETLRADREKQRADAEAGLALRLADELKDLKVSHAAAADAAATAAARAAAASSSSEEDSPLVSALKLQITDLQRTNSALILMVGGAKESAAQLISGK